MLEYKGLRDEYVMIKILIMEFIATISLIYGILQFSE